MLTEAGEVVLSEPAFYLSLLLAWIAFYFAAPFWLSIRGWILGAGSVQMVGALLPGIWQGIFWPDTAGNFGLLMMMLVPIPLCVMAIWSILLLLRAGSWALRIARGR